MRELNTVEVGFVSGGLQAQEGGNSAPAHHWWDGIVDWFRTTFGDGGGGGGLSQEQARKGCEDLGRGLETVESGLMRRMYPGDQVEAVCKNIVENWVNLSDKSPAAICEQVDGGRWNKTTRSCDP